MGRTPKPPKVPDMPGICKDGGKPMVDLSFGQMSTSIEWLIASVDALQRNFGEVSSFLEDSHKLMIENDAKDAAIEAEHKAKLDKLDKGLTMAAVKHDEMKEAMKKQTELHSALDAKLNVVAAGKKPAAVDPEAVAKEKKAADAAQAAAQKKLRDGFQMAMEEQQKTVAAQHQKHESAITALKEQVAMRVHSDRFEDHAEETNKSLKLLHSSVNKEVPAAIDVGKQPAFCKLDERVVFLEKRFEEEWPSHTEKLDRCLEHCDDFGKRHVEHSERVDGIMSDIDKLNTDCAEAHALASNIEIPEVPETLLDDIQNLKDDVSGNELKMLVEMGKVYTMFTAFKEELAAKDGDEAAGDLDDLFAGGGGTAMEKQLFTVVKHMQAGQDRLESKVLDIMKKMPKITAFLEPMQGKDKENASAEDQTESLTRMMRDALGSNFENLRKELAENIIELQGDVQHKASDQEHFQLRCRVDKLYKIIDKLGQAPDSPGKHPRKKKPRAESPRPQETQYSSQKVSVFELGAPMQKRDRDRPDLSVNKAVGLQASGRQKGPTEGPKRYDEVDEASLERRRKAQLMGDVGAGEHSPKARHGEQTPKARHGEQTPKARDGEQSPRARHGEQTPKARDGEQRSRGGGGPSARGAPIADHGHHSQDHDGSDTGSSVGTPHRDAEGISFNIAGQPGAGSEARQKRHGPAGEERQKRTKDDYRGKGYDGSHNESGPEGSSRSRKPRGSPDADGSYPDSGPEGASRSKGRYTSEDYPEADQSRRKPRRSPGGDRSYPESVSKGASQSKGEHLGEDWHQAEQSTRKSNFSPDGDESYPESGTEGASRKPRGRKVSDDEGYYDDADYDDMPVRKKTETEHVPTKASKDVTDPSLHGSASQGRLPKLEQNQNRSMHRHGPSTQGGGY